MRSASRRARHHRQPIGGQVAAVAAFAYPDRFAGGVGSAAA